MSAGEGRGGGRVRGTQRESPDFREGERPLPVAGPSYHVLRALRDPGVVLHPLDGVLSDPRLESLDYLQPLLLKRRELCEGVVDGGPGLYTLL